VNTMTHGGNEMKDLIYPSPINRDTTCAGRHTHTHRVFDSDYKRML